MNSLQNKIDFVALISVTMANPNGDPLGGNRPRTDYDGYGEMSAECIKRKIRNRMQDMSYDVFVQADDHFFGHDEYKSLSARADARIGKVTKGKKGSGMSKEEFAEKACRTFLDVRSFGQVFAFGKTDDSDGTSVGIRGPVSVHQAVSVSPVTVESMQITKSTNADEKDSEQGKKGADTMGSRHFVRFGLYKLKGSINVQLAEKTGFSEEDADIVKECLRTLFVNDASSARPDGSMEVVKLYWWKHNCRDGQYSSAKVHRSVEVVQRDSDAMPGSVEDYEIHLQPLDGLVPEIIDGL